VTISFIETILRVVSTLQSAILLVYLTFCLTILRSLIKTRSYPLIIILPLAALCLHIWYFFIYLARFDFGFNIQICVFIGLLTIALNIRIYLIETDLIQKENLFKIAKLSVISSFLITLEVFDFPPVLGVLDSHALWHGVTIPIPYFYYSYLIKDNQLLQFKLKNWTSQMPSNTFTSVLKVHL